jgi:hypothetical protein
MTRAAHRAALLTLLLASPLPASAGDAPQPGRYDFVNIADSSGPLDQFIYSFPAINNRGTVVFDAGLDDHSRGVFTGNGGPLTTLVHSRAGGTVKTAGEFFDINDAGVVASLGSTRPGETAIFTATPDGHVQVLASGFATGAYLPERPPVWRYPIFGYDITINDAGAVAFPSRLSAGHHVIQLARDGEVETVVDTHGPLANLGRPVINAGGAIAFGAIPDSGPPGLYVVENGALRRVADPEVPSGFHYNARLDMNDHGVIVAGASINNEGIIARHRPIGDGANTGIFAGPDLVEDKVVAWGDPLFGSKLRRLTFEGGPGGINDRGDVVFKYSLADGRSGIAVARAVPEAHLAALPALVVPALMRRRQTRRSAAV